MANINNNAENRVASSANNNNTTIINGKQVELRFVYSDGAQAYFENWKSMIDFWSKGYGSKSAAEYYIGSQAVGTIVAGSIGHSVAIISADHCGVCTAAEKKSLMERAIAESMNTASLEISSYNSNSESEKNNSVDFSGPHASELKRVKITKAVAVGDICGECYTVYFRIAGFEDKPNTYWTISRPVYAYNSDMAKREIMITLDKTIEYLPTTSDSAAIDLFLEKFDEAQKDVHRYYSDYRKADYGDDRIKAIACAMAR